MLWSSVVVVAAYKSLRAMDTAIPIPLAERVANVALELGIPTALIGAAALAVHKYVRGTHDVDMATYVDPHKKLSELQKALIDLGLQTKLNMPDSDDVLGGVLKVWEQEDEDGDPIDQVELVNFYNPFRPGFSTPALAAIKNAVSFNEQLTLRYVRLSDLIALKLFAGSLRDQADIVEVLVLNPDANFEEVRKAAGPYDHKGKLEELIGEALSRLSKNQRGA